MSKKRAIPKSRKSRAVARRSKKEGRPRDAIPVLIVDDKRHIGVHLVRAFNRCNSEQTRYRFDAEAVTTIDESIPWLKARDKDARATDADKRDRVVGILVLDVMFPEDPKRGLELALQLAKHGPTPEKLIRIVITRGQNYADCVKFGRAGAWDYIPKDELAGEGFSRTVVNSALRRLQELSLDASLMKAVDAWLPPKYTRFYRDYLGEYVAFWHLPKGVHMVASGKDFYELAEALRKWKRPKGTPSWATPHVELFL